MATHTRGIIAPLSMRNKNPTDENDLAYRVAKVVFERQRELGMTQQELASRSGLTASAISRLMSANSAPPKLPTLEKLAEAMGARLVVAFEPIEEEEK